MQEIYKGIIFSNKDGNIMNDDNNPKQENIEITGVNDDNENDDDNNADITGVHDKNDNENADNIIEVHDKNQEITGVRN